MPPDPEHPAEPAARQRAGQLRTPDGGRPELLVNGGPRDDVVLGGAIEKQLDAVRDDANLSDSEKETRIATLRDEGVLIVGSGIYALHREAVRKRAISASVNAPTLEIGP